MRRHVYTFRTSININLIAFSTPDHPLAHPFNAIEAQELMRRAREIGYMPFVQEQMSAETPVLKLFHAFDFGLVC